MSKSTDWYDLTDGKGQRQRVTIETLKSAAKSMTGSSGLTLQVILDGNRVEILPLLENIASTGAGSIPVRTGLDVASALGLEIFKEPAVRTSPRPQSLRSKLARLPGQWVAIREDEIVASSKDLSELMARVGSVEASILFIPERSAERRR